MVPQQRAVNNEVDYYQVLSYQLALDLPAVLDVNRSCVLTL